VDKSHLGVNDAPSREALLGHPPIDAPEELVRFQRLEIIVSGRDVAPEFVEHLASINATVPEFAVLLRWMKVEPTDGRAALLAWAAVDGACWMDCEGVNDAHLAVLSGARSVGCCPRRA
jgi:hypothetical protein